MKAHPGKKPVRVHLLTGESVLLVFDTNAFVKDIFDQVCTMYSIKESQFFGLSAIVEGEHRFMNPNQRITKYAPKLWGKELKRRDSDMSVQPSAVFTLQFQVQYYIEHPRLVRDHYSRHHYYLQIKRNVLQSKVTVQDEQILTLAATSLHLDCGSFDCGLHHGNYFDPHDHVPAWFVNKWRDSYLLANLPKMHAELKCLAEFTAQSDYIRQASQIEDVPIHYYKLYKTKRESEPSVTMGIYHQGIRIHQEDRNQRDEEIGHVLDFEFPWSKVGRLFFNAKRFDIYPEDLPASRRLVYYTGSRSKSKYLLRLLRDSHSLHMSLAPYVQHMRKVDIRQVNRRFRESYIAGQDLELEEKEVCNTTVEVCQSSKLYNSSTSRGSSHTSGIESDSKPNRTEGETGADEDGAGSENAFVTTCDDFDPIEHDRASPLPDGNSVTDAYMLAPSHKRLSVDKLDAADHSLSSRDNLDDGTLLMTTTAQVSTCSLRDEDLVTTSRVPRQSHENATWTAAVVRPEAQTPRTTSLTDLSAHVKEALLLDTRALVVRQAPIKFNRPLPPTSTHVPHPAAFAVSNSGRIQSSSTGECVAASRSKFHCHEGGASINAMQPRCATTTATIENWRNKSMHENLERSFDLVSRKSCDDLRTNNDDDDERTTMTAQRTTRVSLEIAAVRSSRDSSSTGGEGRDAEEASAKTKHVRRREAKKKRRSDVAVQRQPMATKQFSEEVLLRTRYEAKNGDKRRRPLSCQMGTDGYQEFIV